MSSLLTDNKLRYVRLGFLGFALAMAVAYDVFFFKKQLGVNVFLFVLFFVAGFTALAALSRRIHNRWAFWFLVPIFVLSLDVLLYHNRLVTEGAPFFLFVLLVVFALAVTVANPKQHPFSFWGIPMLKNIDIPFLQWGTMMTDLFYSREGKEGGRGRAARHIVIGLLVSLPLLFLFGALFANADPIFSDWIRRAFDITPTGLWRFFRTLLITLFLGSFLYALTDVRHAREWIERKVWKIESLISGVVFTLVNLLFLVFVFIQFRYLFGSATYVLSNELTFAEYARSGFFQLVWVLIFAALFLVINYRSAASHGMSMAIKLLKSVFIVQVGVVAVSALHRMNVYQDEFGYTVLRLYVEWFIYFIFALLVLTLVSIFVCSSFRTFFYGVLGIGLIALVIVSSLNVDRMIARENVDRYIQEGKELDMFYLVFELSEDAEPEIQRALEQGFDMLSVLEEKRKNKTKENRSWLEFHF
ncbi:MAG TPA: hypothetical protein DCY48_03980 [Candidatus Magasanikbacteria bacterium]|nr:MAG: hypothetical protein A3I74_00465 [Candidatus Magasanikbacteria bacterium RIFCSPLOWO2_02_FULL_47_16]OGH80076.1 MAG: hypothetical protein A3C10_02760 [Candidatus Magasanikbacteria bacterium RIFCSPHIGHO2_02_FULL_48_18]OGH83339.1 MAG: hypothetical protein A3G08_00340 [Candidatus Magasanikbacteria bacterium RIFCSPLOWO2_12_FULL_47_9b]HAZ28903.1 hypothetical protein [Candidatus Magasanikbacteria bacterium]